MIVKGYPCEKQFCFDWGGLCYFQAERARGRKFRDGTVSIYYDRIERGESQEGKNVTQKL
jgi:hypothetical protein